MCMQGDDMVKVVAWYDNEVCPITALLTSVLEPGAVSIAYLQLSTTRCFHQCGIIAANA